MATDASIFGIPYADVLQVWLGGGNSPMIDPGSFSDTGESPVPQAWTATTSVGQYLIGGRYSSVIGALGTNPNYTPPPDDDNGE